MVRVVSRSRRDLPVRAPAEIARMRRAGRVVAEMHEVARAAAVPGATTADLERHCREVLERRGARSNFLGYHGYPAVSCISVNDEVIHGIPGTRRLEEGDLVSVDCGAIVEGWHADGAVSFTVGPPSSATSPLLAAGAEALDAAVAAFVPGNRLGDVGAAVEAVARRHRLGVVHGYGGHGIGRAMHELPDVPNTGRPGKGVLLVPGATLCVEPMLTAGSPEVQTLADGWTVVTRDGGWAVHVEHTVLVTDHGPEILTRA
jgi:methionyl aminopeptidase